MKQRGFTLIEVTIVIVMVMIVGAMVANVVNGVSNGSNNNVSFGFNGMMETRCVDGYKFTVSQTGSVRQIMDELGHGVKCQVLTK